MLTKTEIQSIATQDNLVIRNLQITLGYYRISDGMRRWMSSENVSWCGFATHASKTAGQALRHELMPRLLKSAVIRMAGYDNTFIFLNGALKEPDPELTMAQTNQLAQVLNKVSYLVSDGNVLVFKELAWPFTSMMRSFAEDWEYDSGKLREFLDLHFRPGPLESGGQDYLIEAFSSYYKARFTTDKKRKAEYILRGNLLIGLHEQTRLQPQIEQALAVPFDLLGKNSTDGGRKKGIGLSRKFASRIATQMMMLITLPDRVLKLGEDVIAPTGVISFPPDLRKIEHPRCRELVQQFNQGLDTLTGSGADNWASLKDRMSFVVAFFRAHQQNKHLFEAPFLESQVPVIKAGHIPAGPL
jgi:hypothetical protein